MNIIILLLVLLFSSIPKIISTIVLADENPGLNFIYYCKPRHYLSTPVVWQRIDSGVSINATDFPIKQVKIYTTRNQIYLIDIFLK